MSAMADYEIWLEDTGRTDSEESQAVYCAKIRHEAAEALAREFDTDVSEWEV